MKVLFAASEFNPLVKVGGLADVVGSLPVALRELGVDARVIIPAYSGVEKVANYCGVPLYYINSHKYFERIYPGGELETEQFSFFSHSVVDWLLTKEFAPDLIHCHDYHTALIPDIVLERKIGIPTILTVHDLSNTGSADTSILSTPNVLRKGLYSADVITTVSPSYAREIVPLVGGREIVGILNGIDYGFYNPRTDQYLKNVLKTSFQKWKSAAKKDLQKELGLPLDNNSTVISMITRLTERKGVRIFVEAITQLIKDTNIQAIVLGEGDPLLEDLLKKTAANNRNFVSLIKFDEGLAHRIYAGSSFFTVPSLFEPCGLTQMIAMRYGAVPIVRNTGGLADSVTNLKDGFVFNEYAANDLELALRDAITTSNKKLTTITNNALKKDFSWRKSASSYCELYEKALKGNRGVVFPNKTIIFSPLRMKRPRQLNKGSVKHTKNICLFCPGNESLISPQITSINGVSGKWRVRVIPNRFPILNVHEVIITTRKHGVDLINLSQSEVTDVFKVYKQRAEFYSPENILIYHNFGSMAGASILHSHSQLVLVSHNLQVKYPTVESSPEYIIRGEFGNFIAYCPRDSQWNWETVIYYKHKTIEFNKLRDKELSKLATSFYTILRSIYKSTSVPYDKWNYNFFITPGKDWQLRIIPRLEIPAGLELASSIEVDSVPPEIAAQQITDNLSKNF